MRPRSEPATYMLTNHILYSISLSPNWLRAKSTNTKFAVMHFFFGTLKNGSDRVRKKLWCFLIFALCGLELKTWDKSSKSLFNISITLPGLPFLMLGCNGNFRFRIFAKSVGENIQKWKKCHENLVKNFRKN
jgi:hypothetical protein